MNARTINPRRHRRNAPPMAIYDKWLLFATMGLILIGLMMVASCSIVISDEKYHQPFHYLLRQTTYLGVGIIFALLTMCIEIRWWEKISMPFLCCSFILLILVLLPGFGHSVNGSTRWLNAGGFSLQVSEVAKLALVLFLAGYMSRHQEEVQTKVSGFLKPLSVIALFALLLLKEPDFGAVVVLLLTALGVMFLAGVRVWQFATLLFSAGLVVSIVAISSPYRMMRLTSFLDPWSRQFDSGYQLTQSLIAFGRGGWIGVGLGASVQKLFYLPEAHTDFLFAVLAEELGLIGCCLVIALFILLVYRGLLIGRRALFRGSLFAGYSAYGLSLILGIQAIVNIGVNIGLLPTKGLTLPFMSYGGSSMLVNIVIIALLLRIDFESRTQMTHAR